MDIKSAGKGLSNLLKKKNIKPQNIRKKKNKGPQFEPCGTPLFITKRQANLCIEPALSKPSNPKL